MCGCIHGCTLSVLRNVLVLTLQTLSCSVFLPYMKVVIYYYALITRLRPSIVSTCNTARAADANLRLPRLNNHVTKNVTLEGKQMTYTDTTAFPM